MKYSTKQRINLALAAVAFFAIIGLAGTAERTEQIIYSMSQESYEAIVEKLGEDASQKQIAREYIDNQSFYDQNY